MTNEQAAQVSKALRINDDYVVSSIIKLELPISESQAVNIQSQFSMLFGNALITKGTRQFTFQDKGKVTGISTNEVWIVESSASFGLIKKYLGLIQSWIVGIRIVSNSDLIVLEIDNYTFPL